MNRRFEHVDFAEGLKQIPETIRVLIDTPAFMKEHQIWKGFWDHSWILIFTGVIAVAFTYILFQDVHDYLFSIVENPGFEINLGDPTEDDVEGEIETVQNGLGAAEILEKPHKPLFSGSLKFLLLTFLEVWIYHFAVRTNNILRSENRVLAFKEFIQAQIRMVVVMGRNWLFGLIMYVIVSVFCSLTDTSYFQEAIMFLIYSYYLGFAFLDNYLEQFHFPIHKSVTCIQTHFGAATVLGVFSSVIMHIPFIGPLAVPFICSIAATRYGHIHQMELYKKPTITIEIDPKYKGEH